MSQRVRPNDGVCPPSLTPVKTRSPFWELGGGNNPAYSGSLDEQYYITKDGKALTRECHRLHDPRVYLTLNTHKGSTTQIGATELIGRSTAMKGSERAASVKGSSLSVKLIQGGMGPNMDPSQGCCSSHGFGNPPGVVSVRDEVTRINGASPISPCLKMFKSYNVTKSPGPQCGQLGAIAEEICPLCCQCCSKQPTPELVPTLFEPPDRCLVELEVTKHLSTRLAGTYRQCKPKLWEISMKDLQQPFDEPLCTGEERSSSPGETGLRPRTYRQESYDRLNSLMLRDPHPVDRSLPLKAMNSRPW